MDRLELPAVIIQEVGEVFKDAVAAAAPTLLSADLDSLERHLQGLSRRVLGRVVERVLQARVAATDPSPPACLQCGGPTRCAGRARPRQLQGLVGDFTLRRPYFVCARCRQGHAPLDAALGLDGSALAPGLARVVSRLGLEGSFGAAADQVAETLGIVVPEEAVRRVTEGIGAVAEAEQQAGIAQAQRGAPIPPLPWAGGRPPADTLVVELDGLLTLHHDGAWHEVKVSRVAPLGPALQSDPDTGRTHLALGPSRYGAGVEPSEAAWWRAYVAACQEGLGAGVRRVVVADGAEWIWAHAPRFLALAGVDVVEIVDIYHAYGHLWTVGNAVFGSDTAAAAAWVKPLKDRLYQEGAPAVLAALAALTCPAAAPPAGFVAAEGTARGAVPPVSEAAAETVRLAEGYFTTHAGRMDYPRFVAHQWPIGSGAVESAGKQLVTQRAKQAGMRWSAAGLQRVLSLRALHRTGEWAAFWGRQPQRRRPPVGRPPVGRPPVGRPPVGRPPGPAAGQVAAPNAPPVAPPVVRVGPTDAAVDQGWMPAGRHDAPPAPPPAPTPLHASGATRPAATHPWRRRFRSQACSA